MFPFQPVETKNDDGSGIQLVRYLVKVKYSFSALFEIQTTFNVCDTAVTEKLFYLSQSILVHAVKFFDMNFAPAG